MFAVAQTMMAGTSASANWKRSADWKARTDSASRRPVASPSIAAQKPRAMRGNRAKRDQRLARVVAVVKTARALQLTSHALVSKLSVRDRGGICHQLANESKVARVKKP